jgi:hypothetical protein
MYISQQQDLHLEFLIDGQHDFHCRAAKAVEDKNSKIENVGPYRSRMIGCGD